MNTNAYSSPIRRHGGTVIAVRLDRAAVTPPRHTRLRGLGFQEARLIHQLLNTVLLTFGELQPDMIIV